MRRPKLVLTILKMLLFSLDALSPVVPVSAKKFARLNDVEGFGTKLHPPVYTVLVHFMIC